MNLDSSYSCTMTSSTLEETIEEELTLEETAEEESTLEETIEEESTLEETIEEESTFEDTIEEKSPLTETPYVSSITETSASSSTSTIIGISSSIAVVVLIGSIVFMRRRKSKSTKDVKGDIESPEETTADLTTSDSTLVIDGHEKRSTDIGMGRAVLESAKDLANSSQIPGVSELATVVSILVNLLVAVSYTHLTLPTIYSV